MTSSTPTSPLTGRTVLVVGASSGMGEGIARHLRGLGATVLAAGRSADRLRPLVDEGPANTPHRAAHHHSAHRRRGRVPAGQGQINGTVLHVDGGRPLS